MLYRFWLFFMEFSKNPNWLDSTVFMGQLGELQQCIRIFYGKMNSRLQQQQYLSLLWGLTSKKYVSDFIMDLPRDQFLT